MLKINASHSAVHKLCILAITVLAISCAVSTSQNIRLSNLLTESRRDVETLNAASLKNYDDFIDIGDEFAFGDSDSSDQQVRTNKRSPKWPSVRLAHLKLHPECIVCGNTEGVEVHHKKSFASRPELELDQSNLCTLCRNGKGGMPCHLVLGHGFDFQYYNPNVERDAAIAKELLNAVRSNRIKSKE